MASKPTGRPTGRPRKYTEKLADEVCTRISEGESLRKITRDADGVKTIGAWTTGVAVTGSAQTLDDGVTVTFAATTGHTLDDQWNIQLHEELPKRVKLALKGLVLYFYSTKGRGVTETVSGQLIGMPRVLDQMLDSLRVESW